MRKRINNPLRKSNRGFRAFLDPNSQVFTCPSLGLGGKQIRMEPIKIAYTILKAESLLNFLPSIVQRHNSAGCLSPPNVIA